MRLKGWPFEPMEIEPDNPLCGEGGGGGPSPG